MTILFAHAGHGTTANGWLHYLCEPIHLVSLLAGVAMVVSLAWIAKRTAEVRYARVARRTR